MSTPVLVLLEEGMRAVDMWNEANKAGRAENIFVRRIIDEGLGIINMVIKQPIDNVQERLVSVTPPARVEGEWMRAAVQIGVMPGVVASATSWSSLRRRLKELNLELS